MTQASSEQTTIWLTQEAYDKLQAELEHLRGPVRAARSSPRISAARDEGDLKENGGYHAAREEQGKTEARIRQLEDMLRRAEVGETPADDGVVEPGMIVTYKFVGDADDEARRSCSAPARSRTTTRPRGLLPAVARSAPRSSATRRARRSPTTRPTASSSRSRSSTRCPYSAADAGHAPGWTRHDAGWALGDAVAAARAGGRAPARRARSPRVSTCSCTSTSSRCRLARGPLVDDVEHVRLRRRRAR